MNTLTRTPGAGLGRGMRVGELARRTGTTVRALRYYESAGLVVPRRLGNGYREYDAIAVRLVAQIRELMALGLTVEETRPFVESIAGGFDDTDVCAAAVATYRSTITNLQERIGRLTAQRDALDARLDAAAAQVVPGGDVVGADPPRWSAPACRRCPSTAPTAARSTSPRSGLGAASSSCTR
ncbi:MerR family transcriptional regulator [Micromonospora sp. M12]